MKQAADTGLIPEPMFDALSKDTTIAGFVQSDKFDLTGVLDLAFDATTTDGKNGWNLIAAMASNDPVKRYWGVLGLMLLDKEGAHAEVVTPLLKDPVPVIRTTAAEALFRWGKKDVASKAMIEDVASEMGASSLLNLLNTIRRYDLLDQLPENWMEGKTMKGGDYDYIKRFSQRVMD